MQRKLEHYRMPATLCSERGWERRPINPVFFAPTDIQPGGLSEELQERLRASQHLIVICSPHSAQSEWVGREIEYFHSLGRTQNIHFFIVDGAPHSGNQQTECFNPVVERLGLPEILGANIHERVYRWPWLNLERAYVQLVSKLLGVEFDTIWRRHRRMLVQKFLAWTLGIIAVVAALVGTWRYANQPFDTELRLKEVSPKNDNLPPLHDAVVTIFLDNETKVDTVRSIDSSVTFSNIPYRYRKTPVRVNVSCCNFFETDTTLVLGSNVYVGLRRDPSVFGDICVQIWDSSTERIFPHAKVMVEGHEVEADDSGYVKLTVPLFEQREKYHAKATKPLIDDTITLPCSPNQIIMVL